jgi:hypothetical protein
MKSVTRRLLSPPAECGVPTTVFTADLGLIVCAVNAVAKLREASVTMILIFFINLIIRVPGFPHSLINFALRISESPGELGFFDAAPSPLAGRPCRIAHLFRDTHAPRYIPREETYGPRRVSSVPW